MNQCDKNVAIFSTKKLHSSYNLFVCIWNYHCWTPSEREKKKRRSSTMFALFSLSLSLSVPTKCQNLTQKPFPSSFRFFYFFLRVPSPTLRQINLLFRISSFFFSLMYSRLIYTFARLPFSNEKCIYIYFIPRHTGFIKQSRVCMCVCARWKIKKFEFRVQSFDMMNRIIIGINRHHFVY